LPPTRISLLLLLWALPASAHTLPIRHRVLATARLEAGRLRADVLLWMQLPAGEHVERLMARYDLNRDGRLAEPEGAMLADDLGPEVVGSFVLRAGGASARPADAKSSARIEADGALSVVVLLSYDLGAPDAVLSLVLREGAPPPREGHERQYVGEWTVLPPLALRATNGPLDPDGRAAGPVPLEPGGAGLEITISPSRPAPLLPAP
jgi:hypothetical protein